MITDVSEKSRELASKEDELKKADSAIVSASATLERHSANHARHLQPRIKNAPYGRVLKRLDPFIHNVPPDNDKASLSEYTDHISMHSKKYEDAIKNLDRLEERLDQKGITPEQEKKLLEEKEDLIYDANSSASCIVKSLKEFKKLYDELAENIDKKMERNATKHSEIRNMLKDQIEEIMTDNDNLMSILKSEIEELTPNFEEPHKKESHSGINQTLSESVFDSHEIGTPRSRQESTMTSQTGETGTKNSDPATNQTHSDAPLAKEPRGDHNQTPSQTIQSYDQPKASSSESTGKYKIRIQEALSGNDHPDEKLSFRVAEDKNQLPSTEKNAPGVYLTHPAIRSLEVYIPMAVIYIVDADYKNPKQLEGVLNHYIRDSIKRTNTIDEALQKIRDGFPPSSIADWNVKTMYESHDSADHKKASHSDANQTHSEIQPPQQPDTNEPPSPIPFKILHTQKNTMN